MRRPSFNRADATGGARARFSRSVALLAASAAAGALVFPLSILGRTGLTTISKEWLLLLAAAWLLLFGWALGYSRLLHRAAAVERGRALAWASICHTPLLLAIALPIALHGSEEFNHYFASHADGRLVLAPMAMALVIAIPLLAQTLVLAAYCRQTTRRLLPMAALILVPLGLRVWGLDWGFPALYHPDEGQYLGRAESMLGQDDLNPGGFINPHLLVYMDYLIWILLKPLVEASHVWMHWLGLGILDPRGDFLIVMAARGVGAVAGTATVAVTYLVGKDLFDRRAALFGALLLAVAFLHVRDSHYTTNDVFATCLLTLSLLFAVRVYRRGRAADYLLAGLLGGLATSAKYNMGFFGAAILAAHLARPGESGSGGKRGHLFLASSAVASLAGFLGGTPFALLDPGDFLRDFQTQLGYGQALWLGQAELPTWLAFAAALAQGFGLVPLVLAILGGAMAARRERRGLAVLLATPLIYLAFMFTQRLFFARFALPVLPALALLAGYAIHRVSQQPRRPVLASGLGSALLLAIAIAQPLAMSVRHNLLLGQQDTRARAAAWFDANAPLDARIVVEKHTGLGGRCGWTGDSFRNTDALDPTIDEHWLRVQRGEFDYVVLSSFGYGAFGRGGASPGGLPPHYATVERLGRLVAVFRPGQGDADAPYAMDDLYTPFWSLWDRERPGPTIKIYHIEQATGAPGCQGGL